MGIAAGYAGQILNYSTMASALGVIVNFYMNGALFDNYVVADAIKRGYHTGERPRYHFYRDSNGTEVDLMHERPAGADLWEIKRNETYHPRLTRTMRRLAKAEFPTARLHLVYGGNDTMELEGVRQVPAIICALSSMMRSWAMRWWSTSATVHFPQP